MRNNVPLYGDLFDDSDNDRALSPYADVFADVAGDPAPGEPMQDAYGLVTVAAGAAVILSPVLPTVGLSSMDVLETLDHGEYTRLMELANQRARARGDRKRPRFVIDNLSVATAEEERAALGRLGLTVDEARRRCGLAPATHPANGQRNTAGMAPARPAEARSPRREGFR